MPHSAPFGSPRRWAARAFRWHMLAFVALNTGLNLANVMTGRPWWAFWPLIVTGMLLGLHYLLYKAMTSTSAGPKSASRNSTSRAMIAATSRSSNRASAAATFEGTAESDGSSPESRSWKGGENGLEFNIVRSRSVAMRAGDSRRRLMTNVHISLKEQGHADCKNGRDRAAQNDRNDHTRDCPIVDPAGALGCLDGNRTPRSCSGGSCQRGVAGCLGRHHKHRPLKINRLSPTSRKKNLGQSVYRGDPPHFPTYVPP